MQGSRTLAITQQQTWDALNDPIILKACIPGCDKVEDSGDAQYAISMALKIGPVAARFSGKITLSDIQAPNSYTLAFEGQGGAAGFGKGRAQVALKPPANGASGCELNYTVHACVGGKVAQLGQRLIDGAAKSMAEDFFRRFDGEMQKRHPDAYAAKSQALATAQSAGASPGGAGIPAWLWLAAALALIAGAVWWLR